MPEAVMAWLAAMWGILAESGPWLLAGFVVAGLIQALVSEERVFRHFGREDFPSVLKASLFGAPLPLCSCSVIPTARALKERGASKGATTSFLIATPETGVDSIGVTWALLDPVMTVVRPLAAVITAIVTGSGVSRLVRSGRDTAAPAEARAAIGDSGSTGDDRADGDAGSTGGDRCADDGPAPETGTARGLGPVLRSALRYGFGPLMADLTPWFLLGFAISALIAVIVPTDFFGGTVPTGWISMVAMLGLSLPMYVCATASTPVAAALVAKGLDPGAALVLLLAGPATNVTTMLVVRDFLGGRVLRLYLLSLVVVSLALGFGINLLQEHSGWELHTKMSEPETMGRSWIARAGGIALGALLVFHAVRERLDRRVARWFRRLLGSNWPA